jgi:methyl-accepting chemotaxis protein
LKSLRALIDEYDVWVKQALAFKVANPERARTVLVDKVMPLGERLDVAAVAYYQGERQRAIVEAGRLAGNADAMWIVLCAVAGAVATGSLILSVRIPRTIGRHLRGAAAEIEVGAANMMAVALQVAAGAAQTAAATNQTTATVEEVKQTAVVSQESASQLSDNAQDVARIAESSRRQAEGTIGAYALIQDQMDAIAEAIDRLSDQTETVGGIMATVSDLAEQSNILSINASIEAAKAGDQGRGFAVVAQEVKSLSEQSKGAVGQVRRILAEIDRAGRSAVQAAEQGRLTIESGSVGVAQAEAGSMVLADAARETARSASEISASSRQQMAGMEQISQAVSSINVAGDQSVEGTRRVEQEVRRLQELASRLMLLVGSDAKNDHRGWAAIQKLLGRNARTRRAQGL